MRMRRRSSAKTLVMAALFLALAYVMPFLTGQIPQIGAMLAPMHIPVLLCGFVCGWYWGAAVGLVAPLLRSLILGMPPLFPTALCMTFELATYGAVAGLAYGALPIKRGRIELSLVGAQLAGRAVWGLVSFAVMGLQPSKFGLTAFLSGAFVTAWPGILIQLILIPILMHLLERFRLIDARGAVDA